VALCDAFISCKRGGVGFLLSFFGSGRVGVDVDVDEGNVRLALDVNGKNILSNCTKVKLVAVLQYRYTPSYFTILLKMEEH
jgi:hypothetical protein